MDAIDREFSWDDAIENDSPEYVVLPEGEYNFQVVNLERKRYQGGAKLPACNMAEVKILVTAPDGKQATVTNRLYLHSRTEGLLCEFFTCIGQREHGQRLVPNWNRVVGSTGRCKLGTREYEGKTYNEVKKFLEPAQPVTPQPWQQNGRGAF
ncbi:MAG: DUF669 domain-containing protein [Clostridia bacterium]|nr:DUF669 domain-containing protein [Clostridia bacterium]